MPSTQTQVSIRINEETEAWLDDRTARYMTGSRASTARKLPAAP